VRVQYTKPGKLPDAELKKLNHGLWMDGKPLLPAKVRWQNDDQLSFTLKEGRKRQIRRMCDMVGAEGAVWPEAGADRQASSWATCRDGGQWRYLRFIPPGRGAVQARVRLELGPDSVMIADLEVRLSRTFRSFLLGEQVQIGCQFINLSPVMQEELARLLDKLNTNKTQR
jgi:hypothetical protein